MAKKKKKRVAETTVEMPKPTLFIDSKDLEGNSFKVGGSAQVLVSGKIVEESLTDYEARGRKSFRLQIHKIKAMKNRAKGRR